MYHCDTFVVSSVEWLRSQRAARAPLMVEDSGDQGAALLDLQCKSS
jgi:hypothetical protein